MQIQRWQTLLLLIAAILMAVLNFLPIGYTNTAAGLAPILTAHAPALIIIDILVCVLLILSIFMYRNLRQQMRVTLLCVMLMCVMAVTGIFLLYREPQFAGIEWMGAVLLLIASGIFALAAYNRMRHDRNLLRSANRLR